MKMNIDLYYSEIDFSYTITVWRDEYIEYEWEKYFNRKFNPMSYFLDDRNSKIYKEIENKWLHNELDECKIRQEKEFNTFLLDKFKDKAYMRYYEVMEEKERQKKEELNEIFNYAHNEHVKEDYEPLTQEELEEIFLENFGGEI